MTESFSYDKSKGRLIRSVRTRAGELRKSSIRVSTNSHELAANLDSHFDWEWLRATDPPRLRGRARGTVRIADLFSGCGMMTVGAVEACRALQLAPAPRLAVDSNLRATGVYQLNFRDSQVLNDPIENLLDRTFSARTSKAELALKKRTGRVDLLLGGPPCQGHSDLNNHTRRDDPKNALLLKVVRAAQLLDPRHIIIENVRGIQHDRRRVVDKAVDQLSQLGYAVDHGILKAEDLGVPQKRHRFFLIGTRAKAAKLTDVTSRFQKRARSFEWAAGDLMDQVAESTFDTPSNASSASRKRIEYLFQNKLHNLPNSERPACHRLNSHSYTSVYGRMYWSKPSQTVTTGFGSMGQGRYVHPKRRRTITPHEASRLQFVPDFFSFGNEKRGAIAEMIGNAVPPKLTYLIALEMLR